MFCLGFNVIAFLGEVIRFNGVWMQDVKMNITTSILGSIFESELQTTLLLRICEY